MLGARTVQAGAQLGVLPPRGGELAVELLGLRGSLVERLAEPADLRLRRIAGALPFGAARTQGLQLGAQLLVLLLLGGKLGPQRRCARQRLGRAVQLLEPGARRRQRLGKLRKRRISQRIGAGNLAGWTRARPVLDQHKRRRGRKLFDQGQRRRLASTGRQRRTKQGDGQHGPFQARSKAAIIHGKYRSRVGLLHADERLDHDP